MLTCFFLINKQFKCKGEKRKVWGASSFIRFEKVWLHATCTGGDWFGVWGVQRQGRHTFWFENTLSLLFLTRAWNQPFIGMFNIFLNLWLLLFFKITSEEKAKGGRVVFNVLSPTESFCPQRKPEWSKKLLTDYGSMVLTQCMAIQTHPKEFDAICHICTVAKLFV